MLHAGPTEVSALAAAGLAVASPVAAPLGLWVELRRKRPVMVALDLTRFAALLSVPAAFALGRLGFPQLLVVSVIVAAAGITHKAASGAYLKALVRPGDLLLANGRLESTTWTATALGPPIGGAAIGLPGPVTTVLADAVSYLFSAAGVRAIGGTDPRPARTDAPRLRAGDLLDGWRHILAHPAPRPLFFNTIGVNGLIMATSPLLAVLWPSSQPAPPGSCSSSPSSLGLVTCMGVFNPVFATYRLDQTRRACSPAPCPRGRPAATPPSPA